MIRPFADTLRDIRSGEALDELARHMQTLVNAVCETGKAGSLTLTIEVRPFERGNGALVLRDIVKAKLPKIESKGTVLFATPEGNLQRNSPRQGDLPGISLASDNPTKAA